MFYIPKSLTFYLYCFHDGENNNTKNFTLKNTVWRHLTKLSLMLSWNFQKTFKTKVGSLKIAPSACRNFSILKGKFWQGKIYSPPWKIRLNIQWKPGNSVGNTDDTVHWISSEERQIQHLDEMWFFGES